MGDVTLCAVRYVSTASRHDTQSLPTDEHRSEGVPGAG